MGTENLIVLIPARVGSSTRGKNLPLIAPCVRKCRAAGFVPWVLTDSGEIARRAKKAGAMVYRERENSVDGNEDVGEKIRRFFAAQKISHQGHQGAKDSRAKARESNEKNLNGEDCALAQSVLAPLCPLCENTVFVGLQCTSPDLTVETIRRFCERARELKTGECLISVVKEDFKYSAIFEDLGSDVALGVAQGRTASEGAGVPSLRRLNHIARTSPSVARQKLGATYRFTGGLWAMNLETLGKHEVLFAHVKMWKGFEIDKREGTDL